MEEGVNKLRVDSCVQRQVCITRSRRRQVFLATRWFIWWSRRDCCQRRRRSTEWVSAYAIAFKLVSKFAWKSLSEIVLSNFQVLVVYFF